MCSKNTGIDETRRSLALAKAGAEAIIGDGEGEGTSGLPRRFFVCPSNSASPMRTATCDEGVQKSVVLGLLRTRQNAVELQTSSVMTMVQRGKGDGGAHAVQWQTYSIHGHGEGCGLES